MNSILFEANDSVAHSDGALLVNVDSNIRSKDDLLRFLSKQLNFPEYFGCNWDAFEECLNDLSWLEHKRVVLRHHDIPLDAESSDRKTYLDILSSAAGSMANPEVVVAFPPHMQAEVQRLLGTRAG
jgi:hypothetical protein